MAGIERGAGTSQYPLERRSVCQSSHHSQLLLTLLESCLDPPPLFAIAFLKFLKRRGQNEATQASKQVRSPSTRPFERSAKDWFAGWLDFIQVAKCHLERLNLARWETRGWLSLKHPLHTANVSRARRFDRLSSKPSR